MIQDTFQAVDELLVVPGDLSEPVVGDSVELSVVVTTRDRAAILDETLQALSSQVWADGSWDVVIVDNGSTDSTPEVVASWVDRFPVAVRVLQVSERFNPSYARNAAVAATMARSVAFVDDDDLIGAGWVAAMGVALRDHELVGSRFEYGELNNPEVALHRGTFQTTELGQVFGTPVISSGGSGVRRQLWGALEGQCEQLGYGGEDLDFVLRAARRGVQPILCEDAIYHVRLRGDWRAAYRQGRAFGTAHVQLYERHGESLHAYPESLRVVARRWAGLIWRLPTIGRPGPRLLWSFQFGQRIGHLRTNLAEKIWYP